MPKIIPRLTAFMAVFSLYGHTFLGVESGRLTPLLAVCIAVMLSLMSILWIFRPRLTMPSTLIRRLSGIFLAIAMLLFTCFGLLGIVDRVYNVNDWGLLLLQIGTPLLLLCNNQRETVLHETGLFCALFATLDAAANIGAAAGIWQLADAGARYGEYGERISRFGGLTGSSLASGLVGLVATGFISSRLRHSHRSRSILFNIIWLTIVGLSLELTDARRYLGGSAIIAALIIIPWGRLVPLPFVSAAVAFGGIYLSFNSMDPENIQRSNLMADGWRDASAHVWFGEGAWYHFSASGTDFNSLWAAHSTESGAIDMAISYGWLATVVFILAIILGLGAKRVQFTWPPVLLAVMAGQIAYAAPLDGFLGAIMFFGCLIHIICDEAPGATPQGTRGVQSRSVMDRVPWRGVASGADHHDLRQGRIDQSAIMGMLTADVSPMLATLSRLK